MTEPPFPPILPPHPTPPRPGPQVDPAVGGLDRSIAERLIEQRRVLATGPLDGDAVTELSAQLMMLDGLSDRDVELIVSSPGGPLVDIVGLLDVIDLMRAPVNAICLGVASGSAAGLIACATGQRRAGRQARLSLRISEHHTIEGSAAEIARQSGELAAVRAQYAARLASAIGRELDWVLGELEAGESHTAEHAVGLGLIDAIADQAAPSSPWIS